MLLSDEMCLLRLSLIDFLATAGLVCYLLFMLVLFLLGIHAGLIRSVSVYSYVLLDAFCYVSG
jgi:hypothetical protein